MRMPWLGSLTLGIGPVDDDHRHIFDLLNGLNASIATRNLSGVRALFEELRAASLEHYDEEERTMLRMGYPALVEHMAEHDRARLGLMQLGSLIEGGRSDQIELALAECSARYFRGVLKEDALLARFLRDND